MGKEKGSIYLHIINESDDHILNKILVSAVPRAGDELRLGGRGKERYYKVTRLVWVYDEPETPFERVNVGVKLVT